MITYTYRPITPEEKQKATFKVSLYKTIETAFLIFGGIVLAFDIPMLIYDRFSRVSSNAQGIYLLIAGGIAAALTIRIMIRAARRRRSRNDAIPDRWRLSG